MAGILKVDQVQSDSNLSFQVAGANVAYMNSTGLQMTGGQIIAGSNTLITSGGLIYANNGIAFPASQVASSNPNTLDDYEEGTWTPYFYTSGSQPTITYSSQRGFYVKVGQMVYCTFRANVTTISGGSGNVYFKGMPFTQAQGTDQFATLSIGYVGGWTTAAPTFGRWYNPYDFFELYYWSSLANETSLTLSNCVNGSQLIGSFTFQANA
jgi:hypothetical protein